MWTQGLSLRGLFHIFFVTLRPMKKSIMILAALLFAPGLVMAQDAAEYINNKVNNFKNIQNSVDQIRVQARIPLIEYKYVEYNASSEPKLERTGMFGYVSANKPGGKTPVFQAASLSKVIFAYVVLRMYDRGEIDLDKPLYNYTDIDRFIDKDKAKRLTARLVLMHRTGLEEWAASPSSDEWPASKIHFIFPVDSIFDYSGEGYAFLQRAVEKIKGKSIQEIAKEEVFDKYDMPNSSYEWMPQFDTMAVASFNREGENRGVRRFPRQNVAYTLLTNAHDYSNFLKVLLNGTGLKRKTYKMMITPCSGLATQYPPKIREIDKKGTIAWGLGIGTEKTKNHGTILWHWGDNGNSKALFIIIPNERKTFVYFANSACGHDIVNQMTKLFFNDTFDIERWINEE